ncbi:hypothetical protein SARC_10072 [Sphaeroforma arctica JP610]|uniref:RRM domain-containing protein n=1 Tax=Sphaeroforma arctica JP610 TaxID=667725 RepID=A0A0L0FL03_9EUKA|nr:hypothetical protein SARC_10072 [Sphaeroforma arctica JP610]KNC77467.1 hypothetical protein SARC_10072 [Sphaeroforma arctica JP610]|eukprot:XP_014151369.1 hypothetical protein SARC_10072 [Sphaeroforma arctica JP610]
MSGAHVRKGGMGKVHKATKADPSSTLFVRGIPATYTDESLQELFGDIGPIKEAFIIVDKETKQSKRFAFVKFALKEDAITCVEKMNGHMVNGKKIQITYAHREEKVGKPKKPKAEASGDDAEMQVVAADGTVQEDKSAHTDSEIQSDVQTETEPMHVDVAEVAGDDTVQTSDDKPQHTDTDQHTGSSTKTHTKQSAETDEQKKEREAAALKDGRTVVVRNVPMGTPKKIIRSKCKKIGRIETFEYHFPTEEEEQTMTAVIVFPDAQLAHRSMVNINGQTLKGSKLVAVLKSRDKQRQEQRQTKKTLAKSLVIVRNVAFSATKEDFDDLFGTCGPILDIRIPVKDDGVTSRGFAFVQYAAYADALKAVETLNGQKIKNRVVAVDFVLPTDDYKKAKDAQESGQGVVEEEQDTNESAHSDAESDVGSASEGSSDDDDAESGSEEDSGDSDDDKDTAKPTTQNVKPQRTDDVAEMCTLFVRNVPFTASESDLRMVLSAYGQIKMCKLVVDRETQRPKGTAFVKFSDPTSASLVIREAQKAVTAQVFSGGKNGKASTVSDGGVQIQGRSLNITLAVDRQQATKLEQQQKGDDANLKSDNRNMRLAREGYISKDVAAASNVSPEDVIRRQKADKEKYAKLKDTRYFVSPVRLVVRNIPPKIDEHELTKVFDEAVIAADPSAQPRRIVKKLNLMRNKENVTGQTIGRSLGWAFVELYSHEYALAALRATNNNPQLYSQKKRLIVEFAVENIDKVRVLEERKAKQLEDAGKAPQDTNDKPQREPKDRTSFKDFILKRQAARQSKRAQRQGSAPNTHTAPATGTAMNTHAHAQGNKRSRVHSEGGSKVNNKRARDDGAKPSRDHGKDAFLTEAQTQKPVSKKAKRDSKTRQAAQRNEAKLDTLVQSYKQKLFGETPASGGSVLKKDASSRWFS